MFYLLGVAVAVALMFVAVPFFFQWLAEEDIFFTTVKEGTAKAIVRGKSFERFIMSFEGYHLNDPSKRRRHRPDKPDWEVLYHGRGNLDGFVREDDRFYDDRPWWLRSLGLYWVGVPWAHSVYVYGFEWNETITDKESGKEKILSRAEATDFIFVADFTYAIETNGAETKDRLPTDELTLVTVAIRNPYHALFSGEDWMRRITAAINRLVRNFVGKNPFSKLISSDLRKFSVEIVGLTEKLPNDDPDPNIPPHGLKERYGVVIRTADLQTIDLTGDLRRQNQEATTRKYAAEQEAVAILVDGKAKAEVIEITGEKEAAALRKRLEVIREHGEVGIALAGYDAIQEASKNAGSQIIWANNPLAAVATLLAPKPAEKAEAKKEDK